jgi:hypothetical protein
MAAISSATPRARRLQCLVGEQRADRAGDRLGRRLVGLQGDDHPGPQATLGVAELVGRLGQAQLGQALGEGAQEGAGARVGDHHIAVPEDSRLVDPPLDVDVVGLGAERIRVAVGTHGDEDPDGQAGECRDGRGQQGQPVLDRAQGDVDERPLVRLEIAGERPSVPPVSATGRSGCLADTWSNDTDWTAGGQMSR